MRKTVLQIKIMITMLTVFVSLGTYAQNIANPDLELFTTCPSQHSRFVSNVTNWVVSLGSTAGTPDYYNSCGYSMTDKLVAQSGNGFGGAYMELNNTFTDYKEYFTSHLSSPLIAGITYTFSFYTAHIYGATPSSFPPPTGLIFEELPDAEQGFIGAVFSTAAPVAANTVGNTTPRYNSIRDDFGSGRALIPKTNTDVYGALSRNNWVRVTLRYTAVGGEEYMTMGQFRPGGTSLAAGRGAYYVFDNFSASLQVLPVELQHFTATKKNNTVRLDWVTVSEQNNKGFEVEHSTNGADWTTIGIVSSKSMNGTSSNRQEYSYIHHTPVNGNNLYRLKQTDLDGKFVYSNISKLTLNDPGLTLFPNPVSSELFINGFKEITGLQLLNVYGQRMKAIPVSNASTIRIDMTGLAPGIYMIKTIQNNGESTSYKILKK
jgi:hypothetical protein